MNELELKQKLRNLGVPCPFYKTPADEYWGDVNIYDNSDPGIYRVYYVDERGGINLDRKFQSESEAFDYIHQLGLSAASGIHDDVKDTFRKKWDEASK